MREILCPNCNVYSKTIKNGKSKSGVPRYKCQRCNKTFILDQSPTKYFKLSDYKFKKLLDL